MNQAAKEVKEHIARAKGFANRQDALRSTAALCDAFKSLLTNKNQIFGREKFEVEILIDEVLRTLQALQNYKHLFPAELSFKRGKEKQFLTFMNRVHTSIRQTIEKAELEKMRKYKNTIDTAVLTAQVALDSGDKAEARKLFRKTAERFAKEPGLLQDVGARMFRAGMVQESIEYLERAIEYDPRDPRPYGNIVMALEELGELERALKITHEALRNFGPNDRTFTIMARLNFKLKNWNEAYDMAQAALEKNEFSREAKTIMEQTAPRIFSKSELDSQGKRSGSSTDNKEKRVIKLDF